MIPPLDLNQLNRQLDEWYANMAEVERTIADPERRLQLRQAMQQVRQGQSVVNAEYQKEIDAIAEQIDAVKRGRAETLARLDELTAQAATPEAPATTPTPTVDPARGLAWRDELLARYAPKAAGETADSDRVDEGSVAKHWEEPAILEATTQPPPPSKPTVIQNPPERAKPKSKDADIWDDLSKSEE